MSDDARVDLGEFSLSLAVRDLAVSTAFYERLGFEAFGGDAASGWRMLRNGMGPSSFRSQLTTYLMAKRDHTGRQTLRVLYLNWAKPS